MTEHAAKVIHHGREVQLVDGERTKAGSQIYLVDGVRCWAQAVIGVLDQNGDPVLVDETRVGWCPVDEACN